MSLISLPILLVYYIAECIDGTTGMLALTPFTVAALAFVCKDLLRKHPDKPLLDVLQPMSESEHVPEAVEVKALTF